MNNCNQLSEHQRMALSIILSDCYFIKSLRFKWQKKFNLYYDFGTYKVNDNYIGNTLLYGWYYRSAETEGIPVFENSKLVYEIAYSIGQFFKKLLENFEGTYFPYPTVGIGDGLKITNKDHNLNCGFFLIITLLIKYYLIYCVLVILYEVLLIVSCQIVIG